MLAKSYILQNLQALDSKYKKSTSPKDSLFFSKLAVLELCGWIEESMDDIVLRCAKKYLKDSANMNFFEKEVIKRTYGFEYQKHFRAMLIKLVGLINVERLESRLDPTKFHIFTSTIETLKKARDSEAHTHIKGVTRVINAPSIVMAQFSDVYDGLFEFDQVIRASKI